MKRGVSILLIIIVLNIGITSAFNLNEFSNLLDLTGNSVKENEKFAIELCKFKSTGPEVVMQKTEFSQVLIWLYEPDKERFGELKLITDFEKVNENKYNFRAEENGPIYTVKAVIPDFCIRFKESLLEKDNAKEVCATNPILTITSVNVGGRELSSGAYETCVYQNYDNEFLSSSATTFPNYGAPVNGRCPPSLCHEIEEFQIVNPIVPEITNECSDFKDEQSCENSSLNCEWVIQEINNPPGIPAECSKNGVENVFLRVSRAISAIFGNIILLFVKIMLFIPNLFGLNADMPFLPLAVDCSQYNMKIQAVKEVTTRGSCEMKPSEEIDLGHIKISGGVGNGVPFIGGPRIKGKAEFYGNINLDKSKKFCGNYEFSSTIRLWVHKDLYSMKYESLTKKETDDIIEDKAKLFPPKDYGSFVVFIQTESKNGEFNFNVKYKKASDSPPESLDNFDITNAKEGSTKVKVSREESKYQFQKKALPALLTLYRNFLAIGTIPYQTESPKYEDKMLNKKQEEINNLLKSLKEDDKNPLIYKKDFKIKVQPLIDQAIDKSEYQDKIKNIC